MIVTRVNWYQTSSPLKLMIDCLVCADGGNRIPRTASMQKRPRRSRSRAGTTRVISKRRQFSVIVHGDTEGAENVRRSVSDWLKSMDLVPAGALAEVDRYIGYWEPYAANHVAYEKDEGFQGEMKVAARALYEAAVATRNGKQVAAGSDLKPAREK